jgi:hypothetical protein
VVVDNTNNGKEHPDVQLNKSHFMVIQHAGNVLVKIPDFNRWWATKEKQELA